MCLATGDPLQPPATIEKTRAGLWVLLVLLIVGVGDGWPERLSSPLRMQAWLLPYTLCFLLVGGMFVGSDRILTWVAGRFPVACSLFAPGRMLGLAILFEVAAAGLLLYEGVHFRTFGYHLGPGLTTAAIAASLSVLLFVMLRAAHFARAVLTAGLAAFVLGGLLSVASFPINYLRSDMLPVIQWANQSLLHGQNPYQRYYRPGRIYDFPYLPGTILVYTPAQALGFDLRVMSYAAVAAMALLLFRYARREHRVPVAMLLLIFLLNPYLQYRHELYTQPYWLLVVATALLMLRARHGWAAGVLGVAMVTSQFSWVIYPFFLLNALRRGGWREVLRVSAITAITAGAILLPFLRWAGGAIGHNAVGQWDNLVRPIARPMNLAFWASYLVPASHLKWIQATLLVGLFAYCLLRSRCATLADTLRWMSVAWAVFILFNVLVDGYFYLMLIVPLLLYTLIANGWLREADIAGPGLTARVT